MSKSLDLGCGSLPKNPFRAEELFGVDVREDLSQGVVYADFAVDPIPFPDYYFDYVTAYDFIEHIPRAIWNPHRRNCFVELMNEVHRVLIKGGLFVSHTPAFPHPEAFQDPTHVNIITEETFRWYFCAPPGHGAAMYGFSGSFALLMQEWRGPHLFTVLQKTNPT